MIANWGCAACGRSVFATESWRSSMIIENIKLAFGAMRGSKMRTLLSLLGIIIGVGSVVAILTIGDSASKSITDSISVGGLDMVTIYPAVGQRSTGTFTEEFGDT